MSKGIGRREFMRAALGAAASSAVLGGCSRCSERSPNMGPVIATPGAEPPLPTTAADLEFELTAGPHKVSLLDGSATKVSRFMPRLIRGSSAALVEHTGGYLGPTIRVKRGQQLRVHLNNALNEDTIIHWHGLYLSEKNDGHPMYAVGPGGQYIYDFKVENRAGTYWYHPHPSDRTGPQVYSGLAGLLLVTDDEEERLSLPDGDQELLLVLQDRTFDTDNQLLYQPDQMIGFLGRQLLVNGEFSRTREVRRGPHRLRILNGSNSRIYNLAWSDGSPIVILGTDGGLLAAPVERAHVVLAPGQRLDVWANFGTRPSEDVWLESRAFDGVSPMMGMGRGMMMGRRRGTPGLPNGAPFRIQRFVATGSGSPGEAPAKLVAAPGSTADDVVNAGKPRTFAVSMRMMRWFLNGRSFGLQSVAPEERIKLGAVEEWEFANTDGHMAMAHPIHLHGPQFRIIARKSGRGARSLREGLLDEGWQDTFLLLPGDRVRLRIRFDRHPGLFLYHCHNLEHEDMGMMRNYFVEAA